MGVKSAIGKTQGGGAFTVPFNKAAGEHLKFYHHQIQVKVVGATTAGTLAVTGKGPTVDPKENPGFATVVGSIDLTSADLLKTFEGFYTELQITPTAFNGTSYDVHITSK